MGAMDLSGIPALQHVGSGTNVTFRIVNFGGTSSSGTWYVYDVANSPAPDLAIEGSVEMISTPSPVINSILTTNGTAFIKFQGMPEFTYSIQAATNLTLPLFWQTIGTATSTNDSFEFIDSQLPNQPARCYRVAFP